MRAVLVGGNRVRAGPGSEHQEQDCAAKALRPSTQKVSDTGPDIDPVKLAGEKYSAVPAFHTFGSFSSSSYAFAQVWVYTDGGQALVDTEVVYPYPAFYRPTWGEVFDHVARQMKCKWSWDPKFRQFKFDRSDAPPWFSVKLPDDWTREDRGLYVWHAPKGQGFGMDIYYFGHYTIDPKDAELTKKVRALGAAECGGLAQCSDGTANVDGESGRGGCAVLENRHAPPGRGMAAVELPARRSRLPDY
ncbi:MAG: hypothetical protein JWP34_4779 [Massilia sp.]|nr:hypothetical protein [Massilia sp.]